MTRRVHSFGDERVARVVVIALASATFAAVGLSVDADAALVDTMLRSCGATCFATCTGGRDRDVRCRLHRSRRGEDGRRRGRRHARHRSQRTHGRALFYGANVRRVFEVDGGSLTARRHDRERACRRCERCRCALGAAGGAGTPGVNGVEAVKGAAGGDGTAGGNGSVGGSGATGKPGKNASGGAVLVTSGSVESTASCFTATR